MPQFSAISKQNLATCDQRLQDIAAEVILIVDHKITQGHRGQADQDKAFAEGKSKLKWPNGNHNSLPSRAMDVAPINFEDGAKIDWADGVAFGRLAGIYQAVAHLHGVRLRFGLDWDGDFLSVGPDPDESFNDAPHIELMDP